MWKFRIWGGWLLVILGIGVLMTMGCEKGALGVKSGVVTGTLVDSDSLGPVVGARVELASKEALAQGGGVPLGQDFITQSDANGRFAFENVKPDSLILVANRADYLPLSIPNSSDASGTGQTGQAGTQVGQKNIWLTSASILDMGILPMTRLASNAITASLILRDKTTLDKLPSDMVVTVSFDGISFKNVTVAECAKGFKLPAKKETSLDLGYSVTVVPNSDQYLVTTQLVAGWRDISLDFYLPPLSYNLVFRCVNVPDYINGTVMRILAETLTDTSVPKIIATQTVEVWADALRGTSETASGPTLPNVALVKNVSFPVVDGKEIPVDIRIQMRGYDDEIVRLRTKKIATGTQGNIRIDIDFTADNNLAAFEYDPTDTVNQREKACLLDNRYMRAVELVVTGPDLFNTDQVVGHAYKYGILSPAGDGVARGFDFNYVDNRNGTNTQNDNYLIPVGYSIPFWATISPTPGQPNYASGSYTVQDSANINPEDAYTPIIWREIGAGPFPAKYKSQNENDWLLVGLKAVRSKATSKR
ncbi:MAG: carboxypeptidase-like regulatory domain-containing protein [Candidatus Ozemobacteraceae bacterium]